MLIEDLIRQAYSLGASDLHLEADTPVVARIRGELQILGGAVPAASLSQVARGLLGADAWAEFTQRGSADFTLVFGGVRCRLNLFQTVRGIAAAVRLLTPGIKDLRACNLHRDIRKFLDAPSGLVILCGPTGSGKSTTLAALIEELNNTRPRHIVTLESPVEYLFPNRQSFIRQREVPTHTPSFEQGITDALRENPDVLVISEIRTPEVMRQTLNAAETCHLVLITMHASTCAEALTRLCMSFPADIQPSVRAQLADCLVAVCCQRLDFLASHNLRVPRCEILLPTSGAKGTIRAGNMSQLANVIQAGGEEGMWTFERYTRWMDQVTDWVHPPAAAALRDSGETAAARVVRGLRPAVRAPAKSPPSRADSADPPTAPKSAAGTAAAPRRASAPGDEAIIEVPAEDLDLASLAELAKKVVERKP